jgi:hypothetical protein
VVCKTLAIRKAGISRSRSAIPAGAATSGIAEVVLVAGAEEHEQIAQAISTQEVERRKESPAKAGLSLQEEPSNVTFTIDHYETSAAAALAM